jgi:hypothetical protein
MKITPKRLSKLVEASFAKFDVYRKGRVRFISQYTGRFYRNSTRYEDETSRASPLNLMYNAITTMVPNLVFRDPRVKAVTSVLAYREYADLLGIAVSDAAKRMRFRGELRLAVLDALFMAGFMKTGLAVGDKVVQYEGYDVNVGEPFAERVDPDDMILDPMARAWDEQAFIGNRWRADLDVLLETKFGDPDLLKTLSTDESFGGKVTRASDIGQSPKTSDEPRKYVDLVEVYLPAEGRIVTMPYQKNMSFDKFIRDTSYDGPAEGPYHMLGFASVPDNLLPLPPAGIWYDLHMLGNRIARKLARQADSNKRVLAYEDQAEEDVAQIADASDGETVRVSDINKIREIEFGGASDNSYSWMEWVKRNFSEQAGSLELLSGNGGGAPTATQAELLQANTSVRIGDMQNAVYDFTSSIFRSVAFYLHTDPLIELPLIRRVNGVEEQGIYNEDMRRGEWLDYNIEIEPFSMARPDPNLSLRRKLEFATNVIPAAAQAAQMLGPGFNVGAYLARIAREVGIEDADEWLNVPEMRVWVERRLAQSMESGDSGKATASQATPLVPPGFNPGQPNPRATGPSGGISPSTEQAMAQQESQAGAQSARSLALSAGGI